MTRSSEQAQKPHGTPPRSTVRGGVSFARLLPGTAILACSLTMLLAATAGVVWSHLQRGPSLAQVLAVDHIAADGTEQKHQHSPGGHEGAEGLVLSAQDKETVRKGATCAKGASAVDYDIVAINVDITLNRYLDHDPQGRMYVLKDAVEGVRREEERNKAAREGRGEPAVTLGLQGDAIQPLTLRVNQGECLRVRLENQLEGEPASFHVHGASLIVSKTGKAAIATNASAMAQPGKSVTYEWMVDDGEPEGTHYFHSHGNTREQTSHGLFGAVIVEPKGSQHLDPLTGKQLTSGWAAIIDSPDGSDFREFALYYHEIGNENYLLLDKNDHPIPQVDPLTSAYRPAARALNYRSEPFMNRLLLQQDRTGRYDESVSYSSYVFGDPATPLMRSYLGDPVKERIIHGGSEVAHVHHVHGGSIRWRRQPGTEASDFDGGLNKHPQLLPDASDRTDSQTIGPSETFDVENECGSGGCQQSAGDFLVHCHVAEHYFSGMWGLWRVYNTMQGGPTSTDSLPPLQELPDRKGGVVPAVNSTELAGKTVDWSGRSQTIDDVASWVERQLPPRGTPKGYDAAVLDWSTDGDLYLNEPETDISWPGYKANAPGQRPPLLFDPKTGKLAYPMLRPHFAKRPPFAPGHGPAPFLDPGGDGDPTPPGANGPASVCPEGTKLKTFVVHAIELAITYNQRDNIVDPAGELFVLRDQEGQVRADNALRVPLTIRANAGEDCVDVVLKSELKDDPLNHGFAKVNAHIHFVQFDVQASDGVIAGFNYEQSVRPFAIEGQRLESSAAAGATSALLDSAERFQPGELVGVGMEQDLTFEVRKIASIDGATLTFDAPLTHAHGPGESVSTEFVRYRWYPDVQFGTAYFHDHVNAIDGWRHGLVGALIAEPPGSTYHDPHSGAELQSGPLADIHTTSNVTADVTGSFRELALFIQDNNPLSHVDRSSGSALNLRVEPLDNRKGDPAQLFSSAAHGDPETPLLEAYAGDPVMIRALVGATNDAHTLHIDGHWFRVEPYSKTSPPTDTVHLGISERFDLMIPKAGGAGGMPGDYLYYNGRALKLEEGSWGLLRVLDANGDSTLQKLPGHEAIPPTATLVCPTGAPEKAFAVAAVTAKLPMLGAKQGKVFVLEDDAAAVISGDQPAQPLVLHVNVGDCLKIELQNKTDGPVSLHADMLVSDPKDSAGVEAGRNPAQAVAPGQSRMYTYYASPEIGETAALLRDWGDVLKNPRAGLYGAIVVGPKGASFHDPFTNADISARSSWRAVVVPSAGAPYRDYTLFFQDEDSSIGTHRMPYTTAVAGVVGVNYQVAPPKGARLEDIRAAAKSQAPVTPLLEAFAGEPVRLHVLAPWSEQAQVFSIEGHSWPQEPGREGTNMLSSVLLGGTEATTIDLASAGGPARLAGSYLYGDHREPFREAGLWGIFRVYGEHAQAQDKLLHLDCGKASCGAGGGSIWVWGVGGLALVAATALAGAALVWRRRRPGSGD